jgi:putative ABC transport system permease protein
VADSLAFALVFEMPSLVCTTGISKQYSCGGAVVHAVSNVSILVEQGEFAAICGRSGSGKTTLMNLLGLLERPDCGLYIFKGQQVADLSDNSRTVVRRRENVELPLIYAGMPATERRRKAKAALDRVGLSHRGSHWSNQLSGGEQQRVALGANLLNVIPGSRNTGGARLESGTQPTLTEEDAASIRHELPRVQVAAPLLSRSIALVAANRNWKTLVAGISSDYLIAREWQIASGRSFTSGDLVSGAKVAIIGSVVERELFDGRPGIGETFRIGNVPFSVVGVLDNKGLGSAGRSQDDIVFIPLATAQSRVLGAVRGTRREAIDFITIKTSDAADMPTVVREIEALLRQRHRIRADVPSDFRIVNPADVLTARGAAVRLLGILLIVVASVSLAVGGISIMNIMLVSVTERTREIGLRMAVGATRANIRWQFLIEALVLALVGGVVGALLGAAIAIAIAWKVGWPVLISPWAIVFACGFAGWVGIFFGLYPAHRAARLDPIAALRFE